MDIIVCHYMDKVIAGKTDEDKANETEATKRGADKDLLTDAVGHGTLWEQHRGFFFKVEGNVS